MVTTTEHVYQQFDLGFRWSFDHERKPDDPPSWFDGLPEGRMWNRTGFTHMPRENMTLEQAEQFAAEWWKGYEKKGGNPADLRINVSYMRSEVWCLTWFSHFTYDLGQSDEEVLNSFSEFVYRMQVNEPYREPCADSRSIGYVLMGAEDRWRWSGDPKQERSPPPCRCEHCKAAGVIRIGH